MSQGPVQEAAVEALARQVVAQVSPAELPLFSATASRYRADPSGTLAPQRSADSALGFGAEAAVVLVTPFVLDLVTRMLRRVGEKLGDSAADGIAARITRWFSRKPETSPKDPEPEPLSPEQLALIAETTRAEAAELALPPEESERLADAIVATLATRS
jgi:hypothetical protein